MPKRQYSDQYINFGFIELKNRGESVPQCMMCMRTLSNALMKLSLLQSHLQTNHPDKKDRAPNYFERLGEKAKKQRLDKRGKQYQQSVGIVTASDEVLLLVAKNKKPHTIAEERIMPAAKVLEENVIGNEVVSKLNSVSVSNNTIQRRITLISKNKSLRKYRVQNMDLPYNWTNQPMCQTAHSFWSMCVILLKMQ